MADILGIDFSENQQANLPFFEWRERGVRFVIGRVSIGYRLDAQYPRALEQARGDGIEYRGGYGVILKRHPDVGNYDPTRQCQIFLSALIDGLTTANALDIEVPGLTELDIRAWCDWYDDHCRQTLMLYGNMYLQALLGDNPNRYRKYPKWVSDYGFFAPGTNAPPLRSEPFQVAGIPRVPAVGGEMLIWQFAGDNGRFPPYTRPIDLSVFMGTENELAALFGSVSSDIQARGKVGPQLNITGDEDATAWLVNGQPSAAVGINIGPPGEVTQPLFWTARNYENAWNPTDPQRDGYSGDPLRDARRYADLWLAPWAAANPWAKLLAGPNEPIVNTVAEMEYTARFFAELVRIIHVELGRVAVIGNWSVTHPRVELWDAYVPALRALAQYGGFHARHSYGPLESDFALRHRVDNEHFTRLGYPNLPTLITECGWENIPDVDRPWGSEPRRSAQEYADYLLALNDELMRDPYVYGASVFVHGINWSNHNLNGSGVGRLMGAALSQRPVFTLAWPQPRELPPEGELSMGQIEAIKFQTGLIREAQLDINDAQNRINAAQAEIDRILAAPPERPWWDKPTPYKFTAQPNPALKLYKQDKVTVDRTLNYTGWAIDVFETTPDGWLRITGGQTPGAVGLWLRAADITPT